MSEDIKGTARLLSENRAYEDMKAEYGEDIANGATAKNLQRHGVQVPPEGVGHWNTINRAAFDGKLDVKAERAHMEGLAAEAAATMLGRASIGPLDAASDEDEAEEDIDDSASEELDDDHSVDVSDDDDDRSSLPEIYNCDNEEDAQEQALDDVLKIVENAP